VNNRVGLTGNMGSGKTLVSGIFNLLGIPVYNADQRARQIMVESDFLKSRIIDLLGKQAYHDDGTLDRDYIASRVFTNSLLLDKLNKLVHPAVALDAEEWADNQRSSYTLHEAALLIQSGSAFRMRYNILVSAPKLMRVDRIKKRNGWSDAEILDRLQHQWSEEMLQPHCRFVIQNDGKKSLIHQVLEIHRLILRDLGK
jgi:dephospho-CoA kinase